eukprot:5113366-Amphidinium_carterae.1
MELCEGDLQWFRSENGPGRRLPVREQVMLMEQASSGCAWIADKKIVHRDLKLQNILIAKPVDATSEVKYIPKIADFGLAKARTALQIGIAGTRGYMAPEAYAGCYSEKSDVYSFGH